MLPNTVLLDLVPQPLAILALASSSAQPVSLNPDLHGSLLRLRWQTGGLGTLEQGGAREW